MAEHSPIEWTDATWNPITGCSVASPGCTNCYAMKLAGTRLQHHSSRAGLTRPSKAGPVWTGEVRLNEAWLDQPLRWKRPRRIFVCAHGDLFHEAVPDAWIDQVFAIMARARQHTFQVLTKRAARMRAYVTRFRPARAASGFITRDGAEPTSYGGNATTIFADDRWPLPNVWLGVSAEDQARADARVPELLETPAAVRFVSLEPLLGPVRLDGLPGLLTDDEDVRIDALAGEWSTSRYQETGEPMDRLDWVIVGGESGPDARPMHPDWARRIRDDCAAAGVPLFFKQWGSWTPGENVRRQRGTVRVAWYSNDHWSYSAENLANSDGHIDDEPDVYEVGKAAAGRLLDGRTHDELPDNG